VDAEEVARRRFDEVRRMLEVEYIERREETKRKVTKLLDKVYKEFEKT